MDLHMSTLCFQEKDNFQNLQSEAIFDLTQIEVKVVRKISVRMSDYSGNESIFKKTHSLTAWEQRNVHRRYVKQS